jgi:hypothetical protein
VVNKLEVRSRSAIASRILRFCLALSGCACASASRGGIRQYSTDPEERHRPTRTESEPRTGCTAPGSVCGKNRICLNAPSSTAFTCVLDARTLSTFDAAELRGEEIGSPASSFQALTQCFRVTDDCSRCSTHFALVSATGQRLILRSGVTGLATQCGGCSGQAEKHCALKSGRHYRFVGVVEPDGFREHGRELYIEGAPPLPASFARGTVALKWVEEVP